MTTNSCAVPTCDTGRQSVKKKRSVFRVPANIERRQKWISAIPDISQLMPSQFVCEKHFLERYILRKWVKHDLNGRVIAEVPYARPRLDPLAVPSEFDNLNQVQSTNVVNSSIEEHVKAEHSYCSMSESSTTEVENAPKDAAIVTSRVESKEIPMDTSTALRGLNNDSSMDCSFASTKLLSRDCSPDAFNDRIETSSTQDLGVNKMLPSDAPTIESMQEQCHFQLSEAAFSCTAEGITQSISIPKPWTGGELNTDGGSLLFSYAVSKVKNGHNVPVTQRFVKLTANKQLFYYVYGRIVDAHGCNLPQVLDDLGALPHTLKRFKNLSLCNGLDPINDHHLPPNSAFKDDVDMWRNKNCTLISKSKRCVHCIKCRDATLKREARSKTETSLKRVTRASNPIDQRKLMVLRKENARIKRLNDRNKKRLCLLQKCLQHKANEITSICSTDRCQNSKVTKKFVVKKNCPS